LEIKEKSLRYILYVEQPENPYKKDRRNQNIYAPNKELENIQKKLTYV
jgi:hypothetical protein